MPSASLCDLTQAINSFWALVTKISGLMSKWCHGPCHTPASMIEVYKQTVPVTASHRCSAAPEVTVTTRTSPPHSQSHWASPRPIVVAMPPQQVLLLPSQKKPSVQSRDGQAGCMCSWGAFWYMWLSWWETAVSWKERGDAWSSANVLCE